MEITRLTPAPRGDSADIWCDGSCPKNPGPMGIGYVMDVTPQPCDASPPYTVQYGTQFPDGTNNRAEYLALIFALRNALRCGVTHPAVFLDSLLVVNHVKGIWKCRDGLLKPLLEEARGLLLLFSEPSISHVPREQNERADKMSRSGEANPSHIDSLGGEHSLYPSRGSSRRKLSREQAAMIRWWWKSRRCQNPNLLGRIFGMNSAVLQRVGRGDTYKDITEYDLPGSAGKPLWKALQEAAGGSVGQRSLFSEVSHAVQE